MPDRGIIRQEFGTSASVDDGPFKWPRELLSLRWKNQNGRRLACIVHLGGSSAPMSSSQTPTGLLSAP